MINNGGLKSESNGMKLDNSLKALIKSEASINISNICIRLVPPFQQGTSHQKHILDVITNYNFK